MKLKHYILVILFLNIQLFYGQTNDINNTTGGSIKTHPGSQMGIFGNLNNNGNFTENGGEVGFYNQDDIQTISGNNAPEISDLIVDVPNDLNIEINTIVKTGVIFNQGRVITPRMDSAISLDLIDTDLYINESDITHVDGYTSYTGSNTYTFPIGDDFRLRTLSIETAVLTSTNNAAYFYEDPNTPSAFSSFNTEELDDDVGNVSPIEFWDLDGNISTRVTLTWDILSSVTNLVEDNNLNELFVVGWSITEDKWVNLGNTNVNGDENQGALTSESFIPNNYEIITFGGPNDPIIPINDISIPDDIPNNGNGISVLNSISNNGDHINSYFRIKNIENFPNNSVQIFNRWGVKVFEKEGYLEPDPKNGDPINPKDVFTGISNGRTTISADEKLPTGTYFYVLNYGLKNSAQKRKAGFLYLQQ